LTALYLVYYQNQLNCILARNVASFDVIYYYRLEKIATFDWLNG